MELKRNELIYALLIIQMQRKSDITRTYSVKYLYGRPVALSDKTRMIDLFSNLLPSFQN